MYLMGVDCGSTKIKALLFTREGREAGRAERPMPTYYPKPGWVQIRTALFRHAVFEAMKEALHKSGIAPQSVRGIGCTGFGNGLFMADRLGKLLPYGISSADTRAKEIVVEWTGTGVDGLLFDCVRQKPWPGQTAALYAWMSRYMPDITGDIGTIMTCKDAVNVFLTGATGTDYTDMSAAGLLNIQTRSYDERIGFLCGAAELIERLPPLHQSAERIGELGEEASAQTGIPQSTPVVAGCMDIHAAALGTGLGVHASNLMIAGTWGIHAALGPTVPARSTSFASYVYFGSEQLLEVESSPNSMTNLEWFAREFGGEERLQAEAQNRSLYDVLNERIGDALPARDAPHYLPYLYSSPKSMRPGAGFYGVAAWHRKLDMLRAVYEGIILGHRFHVERFRSAQLPFSRTLLAGGAAASKLWGQWFADGLKAQCIVTQGNECGAKGAAMLAGIGIGWFTDYEEAIRHMVQADAEFIPREHRTAQWDERFASFIRLIETVDS